MTTRRFQDIDLSRLPPPAAIEEIDFESIRADRLADFQARWEALRADYPELPQYDVSMLETDPVVIIEETDSYHETLVRSRVNDAVRAVMLASSWGTNLDQLGARVGTVRLEGEQDAPYKRRIQIAYEALSTAGPYGAYVWHALSAHPGIKDVAPYGPEEDFVEPGEAWVSVLGSSGMGAPTTQMLMAVAERLGAYELRLPGNNIVNVWNSGAANAQSARPLTDKVIVHSTEIITYQIQATLWVPPGPDAAVIESAAQARLVALTSARHKIGGLMARSLIESALHVLDTEGESQVETVDLVSPAADVGGQKRAAPYCTGIDLTVEVLS